MASSYLITTHTPGTLYIEIWNLSWKTRVDGYLYLSFLAKRFYIGTCATSRTELSHMVEMMISYMALYAR